MSSQSQIKVFVSDIQPILPAIAGGRLRLAGIWGNVPDGIELNYVGTFDNPGEQKTIKKLGPNATEILVPCSSEHFASMAYANAHFPDITLFDLAFHRFASLSQEYLNESIALLKKADIVVFSHPWSYPLLKSYIDTKKQYLIYDSQNVESFLRADILMRPQYGQMGRELLEDILEMECNLANDANLILACSQRDTEQFSILYGIEEEKLIIAPNGVNVSVPAPQISFLSKKKLKKRWGLKRPYTVVFSGSSFEPNIKALHYLNKIAFNSLDIDFIITGNMNNAISPRNLSDNMHMVGLVSQQRLNEIYKIADVGVNPMEYGSGSNIKVFTYMEAQVPVLSTPLGARGLDVLNNGYYDDAEAIAISSLDKFESELKRLLLDSTRREGIAKQAYVMIEKHYSWKEISKKVCQTMKLKFQL